MLTSVVLSSILLATALVASQNLTLRLIKLDEFDQDERSFLSSLNTSRIETAIGSIEYSTELTSIAQVEAERLSNLGHLELPELLNLDKPYYGFSSKLNGKFGNIYVGYRICHNNILNVLDLNVYSFGHDCSPVEIETNSSYEIGIGRSFDRAGNIFSVRLFYSKQKRKTSANQELIPAPEKVSLDEHDRDERAFIESYNRSRIENGHEPLRTSPKLTRVAQNEAERLANLGDLEFPQRDMRHSYYGSSFKIEGKIDGAYVGFKICHDTIVHNDDKAFYFVDDNCYPDGVDQSLVYYFAFGSAIDASGNVFKVRIFSSAVEVYLDLYN